MFNRRYGILVLVLLLFVSFQAQAYEVQLNATKRLQGEVLVVQVTDVANKPTGSFRDYSVQFYPLQESWVALIGISYWVEPATYPLEINLKDGIRFMAEIQILPGKFGESRLTVSKENEEKIRPTDPEIVQRKERDQEQLAQAYSYTEPTPLWSEPFIQPTEGVVTTGFGHTRYVNGTFNNRHSGIDLANHLGTPIRAVNDGNVHLAEELVVTGNTLIIDHGAGLFSAYYHLSEMLVAVGDQVERGQIIGKMGSTGFSTGSHLHWKMMIGNANLNPNQFVGTSLFDRLTSP